MERKIENLWKTYQMVNDWVKFSDIKAGVVITVIGLCYTIIYTNANTVYSYLTSSNLILILAIITIILSMLSGFYAFKCLNPRLNNQNPNSILYFGHISQNANFNAYITQLNDVFQDNENVVRQLAEQVHTNSKIAWNKFINVTYSIRFFFIGISLLIINIIIYFLNH